MATTLHLVPSGETTGSSVPGNHSRQIRAKPAHPAGGGALRRLARVPRAGALLAGLAVGSAAGATASCTSEEFPRDGAGASATEEARAHSDPGSLEALESRLVERFTPGLHTLMAELQHRHATLWFAGDAENWPLADYFLHEMEELMEEIETLHPDYDGVAVAELLTSMTLPAMEELEAAVEDGDATAFRRAYDRLTTACNACHVASDREALVIQRPTAPPLTNLRYLPGRTP